MPTKSTHARKWVSRHISRLLLMKSSLQKELDAARSLCQRLLEGVTAIGRYFVKKTAYYREASQTALELAQSLTLIERTVLQLSRAVGL